MPGNAVQGQTISTPPQQRNGPCSLLLDSMLSESIIYVVRNWCLFEACRPVGIIDVKNLANRTDRRGHKGGSGFDFVLQTLRLPRRARYLHQLGSSAPVEQVAGECERRLAFNGCSHIACSALPEVSAFAPGHVLHRILMSIRSPVRRRFLPKGPFFWTEISIALWHSFAPSFSDTGWETPHSLTEISYLVAHGIASCLTHHMPRDG